MYECFQHCASTTIQITLSVLALPFDPCEFAGMFTIFVQINWTNEKACFDGFAREYSRFCAINYDPFLVDSDDSKSEGGTESDVDGKTEVS